MHKLLTLGLASLFLVVTGCQDTNTTGPLAEPSFHEGASFGAPDIVVPAGGSIQAAVDAAGAGSVIHIEPGTYSEAVTIDKPGIKLIGLDGSEGGVVIENPGGEENGINVTDNGDDFALINVTVRDFDENGVFLFGVDKFLISHVTTEDNGEYGIFPAHSAHGRIEHSSASGHSDTGIYVGQSRNVRVRQNVAFGNVIGFEVENSSFVQVTDNEAYDNVAGILVVLLPGLDVKESSNIRVAKNSVHDNNHVNFAEPGELAAAVPTGSGILVVGTDRTNVKHNTVTGNDFVGIGVASSLLLGALAGIPPEAFADIEPNPDGVRVQNNVVTTNGASPPPIGLPGVDLLWDGSGTKNCWSGNTFATAFPSVLPPCDDD